MVIFLPGSRPRGPLVPIVIVSVCPSPSGDLCSFSRVIPLLISALNCSSSSSLPATLIFIDSMSGASNNPGISSVIRIRLIVALPELTKEIATPTFWFLYDLRPVVEYFFDTSASSTSNDASCNFIDPSVDLTACGRIVRINRR